MMHNNGLCGCLLYVQYTCMYPPPVAVKKIQSKKDIMLTFFAYLMTSSTVFAQHQKGAQKTHFKYDISAEIQLTRRRDGEFEELIRLVLL